MTRSPRNATRAQCHGSYRECYVAFLDILGFRDLISRSECEGELVTSLSRLTAVSAQLRPGTKETSWGPCPMQTRSFSDSVVVFTPTQPGEGCAKNGLAQLLFVARFIHDEVIRMEACIRGAVTIGKMYWHPQWNRSENRPSADDPPALPLTFGPGLVAAYDLESKHAKVPRVLIDNDLREQCSGAQPVETHPFGKASLLSEYFKEDEDGRFFLDLLHKRVTRSQDELMRVTETGFTIEWTNGPSHFTEVRSAVAALARDGVHKHAADPCVLGKYEWLLKYATAAAGTNQ